MRVHHKIWTHAVLCERHVLLIDNEAAYALLAVARRKLVAELWPTDLHSKTHRKTFMVIDCTEQTAEKAQGFASRVTNSDACKACDLSKGDFDNLLVGGGVPGQHDTVDHSIHFSWGFVRQRRRLEACKKGTVQDKPNLNSIRHSYLHQAVWGQVL